MCVDSVDSSPGQGVRITIKGFNNVDKHLCRPKVKVLRATWFRVHFEGMKCLHLHFS